MPTRLGCWCGAPGDAGGRADGTWRARACAARELLNALLWSAEAHAFDASLLPPTAHPELLALDNVVLLPHLGSATIEGREASGEKVIANIRAWSDGHRPPDQVLEGWA